MFCTFKDRWYKNGFPHLFRYNPKFKSYCNFKKNKYNVVKPTAPTSL